jgi:DNA invertase Pin-like site-specific DNA recombinase
VDPQTCVIYDRISEDREHDRLGVERHTADCRELAARLGHPVAEAFEDDDFSAYRAKHRPDYRDMLDNWIKTRRVRIIIVWHYDRLYRNMRELEELIDMCQEHALVIHAVKAGPLDLSTATGQMNARIVTAVAVHESAIKGERVASRYKQRVMDGGFGGGRRRFGFEKDGLTICAKEAAEIEMATLAVLNGQSLRSITRDMNERGIRTTDDHEWTYQKLRRTLRRPMNCGRIMYKGQEIARMPYAIVTEGQFEECDRLLKGNSEQYATASNKVSALGSGIYLCAACDGKATLRIGWSGENSDTSRKRGYRCSDKDHLRQTAATLDEFVTDHILTMLREPGVIERYVTSEEEDLSDVYLEKTVLAGKLEELGEMFASGDIDAGSLKAATKNIRARQAELDTRIMSAASRNPIATIASYEDVAEGWAALDLSQRRAILMKLVTVTIKRTQARGRKGFDPDRVVIGPPSGR